MRLLIALLATSLLGCNTVYSFATPQACKALQAFAESIGDQECATQECRERLHVYAPLGGVVCGIAVHEIQANRENE